VAESTTVARLSRAFAPARTRAPATARATSLASRRLHGLAWVLAALAVAVAPHLRAMPAWIPLLLFATGAWRGLAAQRGWPLVSRWLRVPVVVVATLAVLGTYRTLTGVEAGTAFLVLMAAAKLLETRAARDLTVLVFIAWFLLYAALLRDQALTQLPWLLGSAFLTTFALMRVHAEETDAPGANLARRTLGLMLQAVPIAVLLFLLFPRLPGPFWGVSAASEARTGLDDVMTPGDVSDLSASGAVAFRARFHGPMPTPEDRYWRGPVLHEFDGRSWRRPVAQAFAAPEVRFAGAPLRYRITLEPHARRWVLALDLPSQWPQHEVFAAYDFTLLAARPIGSVTAFELASHPRYVAGTRLSLTMRRKDLSLPTDGSNPRSVALGRELAARHGGEPRAIVGELLRTFREQPFEYTMQPPRLADNAVDEFLFETRKGFCEHYASAFTVVMRAAGVPARVVTGYQGGQYNPYGDYLIVRQSDAHAWSEVWIDGRGWVRVDPTAAVAPERIRGSLIDAIGADEPAPGRLRDASPIWLQLEMSWDAVNDFWNQRVLRFDASAQFDLMQRLGVAEPDWRTLGLGLAGSLAMFFASLSAYMTWRYRPPPRDWPARLHDVAVRRLRKRGLVLRSAEGPIAFLQRAETACPDLARQLREIRLLYASERYGPRPRPADLQRLKHLVNALRP
jgi:transglutaminase-like putative cysteine protease